MAKLLGQRMGLGTVSAVDAAAPATIPLSRYLPPNTLYDGVVWELNLASPATAATLQLCLIRNDDPSQRMVDATSHLQPPRGQTTNVVPAGTPNELLADTVTLSAAGQTVVRTPAYEGYRHALRVNTLTGGGSVNVVGAYERLQ